MFQSGIQIPAGTAGICRYEAGTAGISTGTKHRGQPYRIAGRYGIFRPYRPVRYGIDNIVYNTHICTTHFASYIMALVYILLFEKYNTFIQYF